MREYVLRMAHIGIPLRTAVKIYNDCRTRDKLNELRNCIEYVEGINGRMEGIQPEPVVAERR